MEDHTSPPTHWTEDRGKARQDSTTPSVQSATTDERLSSPRESRRRRTDRPSRPAVALPSGSRANPLRRRSSSRSESFGPHAAGPSRDNTATMQRSINPSDPDPITYTPTTHRVSKAKKGKRVHACEYPGCDKVYTLRTFPRRPSDPTLT